MRGRFRQGWGLAWGLVSVGIMIASRGASSDGNTSVTVVANPSLASALLPEPARIILLYALCALGAGIGSYLALTATTVPDRARRSSALMWGALAVLTVAANLYLLDQSGPRLWSVHLGITLTIAGAVGGLIQSLIARDATSSIGIGRAAVWMLIWSIAFIAAKYVGVVGVYLLTGLAIDALEKIGAYGAHAGRLLGWFAGGYVAGYVMGAIASFSPGIAWSSPGLPSTPRGPGETRGSIKRVMTEM